MGTRVENNDLVDIQNSNSSTLNSYAAVLSKGRPVSDNNFNTEPNVPNEIVDTVGAQELDSSEQSQSSSFEESPPSDNSVYVMDKNGLKTSSADDSSASIATMNTSECKSDSQHSVKVQLPDGFSGSESEEESDLEDETDELGQPELYPSAIKWQFRSKISEQDLPETVTVLTTNEGSKVYVVGTAHFSTESQEDVSRTIRAVQPDVVMIELCKSRVNILTLDEETILEETKNINFQKIRAAIEQNGMLQSVVHLLLLSMSAYLTRQLGMAPGGEFRRAFTEAKQIPGCLVHLGDRPIHITLQRALATLNWWQKLRIAWHILRSKDPISKEEIERCKQKDLLEEMLAEMTGEFPELSRVFVKERDIYLAYSLQMSATPVPSPHSPDVCVPSYVVGVVGIGHVPGIIEHWGKVTEKDVAAILRIPEPSLYSRVLKKTVRYSLYGLGVYGIYKLFPRSLLPQSMLDYSFVKSLPFFKK
ncbi:traB domain-containing protein-like isoform X2 [Uloborus diversus]|nr:traB domain-containing protein-like isoform X2 [Uloborus diversus]XP_054710032.1 traB domain-containing protein-like isoform X2 [Uloborus diversus]